MFLFSVAVSKQLYIVRIYFRPIKYNMIANILVPVILFVLLSPGILITVPKGQPKIVTVLVHAVVFGLVYAFLRRTFPTYY